MQPFHLPNTSLSLHHYTLKRGGVSTRPTVKGVALTKGNVKICFHMSLFYYYARSLFTSSNRCLSSQVPVCAYKGRRIMCADGQQTHNVRRIMCYSAPLKKVSNLCMFIFVFFLRVISKHCPSLPLFLLFWASTKRERLPECFGDI